MRNVNGNIIFDHRPQIASYASVAGKKEGEGPLKAHFDRIVHDSYAGKDTFEQAESQLMSTAVQLALDKGRFSSADVDLACCGDLLNQCVASSFAMRRFGIPYAGMYGACSTMALNMIMAACAVEGGAANRAVCAASSHYCTAERQYRFPLEYGSQRPPTAQWTVTGAGACVIASGQSLAADDADPMRTAPGSSLQKNIEADRHSPAELSPHFQEIETGHREPAEKPSYSQGLESDHRVSAEPSPHYQGIETGSHAPAASLVRPSICSARIGRIVDYQIKDQNNMGAAMAPAVVKLGTILFSIVLYIFIDKHIFAML